MELYELCRKRFGWGSFDEATGESYITYRNKEVGQIKRIRARRRIPIDAVVDVVDYCIAHRKNPTSFAGLMRYDKDARSWRRSLDEISRGADLQKDVDDAIAYELTLPDSTWVDLLVRAVGDQREEVLEQWRTARQR